MEAPPRPEKLSDHTLATVLFSRTLPLIRYQLSDRIRLLGGFCGCGLPFPRIAEIGGRAENTLLLPESDNGMAAVDVDALGPVIERFPVVSWQAAAKDGQVQLTVAGGSDLDLEALEAALRRHLEDAGIRTPIAVRRVDNIPRSALGKSLRVVAPDC